jgi:hypothetical protein
MNPLARRQPSQNFNPPCPDLVTVAERELSAFFNAVSNAFGSKQAKISAEDWLQELIKIERLPASTREWRSVTRKITAKVSTRLARRVNGSTLSVRPSSSLSTEPQIA